jgi:predicted nuclease of restriction endonuclease-like RecB superfamily
MTKKTSDDPKKWAQQAFDRLKKRKDYKFRSKLEKSIADLLDELKIDYEFESTKLAYTIAHHYTPDFILPNKHVVLEAKGYWSPADRRKILAVKRDNPDMDIRMVFQNPYNTITKKSKTTYAKWCEKHDIPWTSFQNIPIEWLL